MRLILGIDVGGTFTDGIALDEAGIPHTAKVPSTPAQPNRGFIRCLSRLSETAGVDLATLVKSTDLIVHGTTISVNSILTGQGVPVALITTKGFRDIIETRRGQRESMFDLKMGQPRPLVPRYLRRGVRERVDWSGRVLTPLDESEVDQIAQDLKKLGVRSVAVSLLHSFMNPSHEEHIGEIVRRVLPEAYLSLSCKVLPVIREYERTSTTVINSYVGPILQDYITRLLQDLSGLGFKGELLLMHSGGGVMSADSMKKMAVYSVFSGPAAAPSAALLFAGLVGSRNILTIDMGGTSFDVTRVYEGSVTTASETKIDRYHISVPAVEVHTIGAGGGSIAFVDSGSMLHVGPNSAGADPGPVCYAKGGTEPTVTDANLVLGYLNPNFFLGGEIKLSETAAEHAIRSKIAGPLDLSVSAAANGIFRVVNENMTGALRTVLAKRGDYPSDFVLVAGGGAGATHACYLAAEIGIKRIFVPKLASFLCALGMISSDLKYDLLRSHPARLDKLSSSDLARIFVELKTEGSALLAQSGVSERDRSFVCSLDMRYSKQVHEVEVEVKPETELSVDLETLKSEFHTLHEHLYTYRDNEAEIEVVTYRVVAKGKRRPLVLRREPRVGRNADNAIKATRRAFFDSGFVDTPVFDGSQLRHGNVIEGPAIVEDSATTVVLPHGFELSVDELGNYHEIQC